MTVPLLKSSTLFKPGQSGNPSGRPKLSPELRAIRALDHLEVSRLISKYARMSYEEVQAANEDKTLPMVESCFASLFLKGKEKGDWASMAFLLDRACGKLPLILETDEEKAARAELNALTDDELVKFLSAQIPALNPPRNE